MEKLASSAPLDLELTSLLYTLSQCQIYKHNTTVGDCCYSVDKTYAKFNKQYVSPQLQYCIRFQKLYLSYVNSVCEQKCWRCSQGFASPQVRTKNVSSHAATSKASDGIITGLRANWIGFIKTFIDIHTPKRLISNFNNLYIDVYSRDSITS